MNYMDLSECELGKVLSVEEIAWLSTLRIPYQNAGHLWAEKHRIDEMASAAIAAGKVKPEKKEVIISRSASVISDDLGIHGILNHADGKKYDSKSSYYKAVKAAGCEVMGNDAPREAKQVEAKICDKELKRDIAQAIQQLGG